MCIRDRRISVLLGIGGGALAPKIDTTVAGPASTVDVGDLNGDARPDLAVGYTSVPGTGSHLSILWGTGTGGFSTTRADLPVAADTRNVHIRDLNGDGRGDLAVAVVSTSRIAVLLNTGSGTFAPAANYPVEIGAVSAALDVGDVTGDGLPDLVVSDRGFGIAVLNGFANGTFGAKVRTAMSIGVTSVHLGDLDGDGRTDIAASDAASFAILRRTPAGAFTPFGVYSFRVAGATTGAGTVGDIDGDHRPDLVGAMTGGGGTTSVLLGATAPILTWNPPTDFAAGTTLTAAQLNATASVPGTFVYAPAAGTVLTTGPGQTLRVTFTPTDIATYASVTKSVAINVLGPGEFGAATSVPVGTRSVALALRDLNGDGWLDLISGHDYNGTLSVRLGTGTVGSASFGAETGYPTTFNPTDLALADLNGDTKLDVAVVGSGPDVMVFFGTGTGAFGSALTFPTGAHSADVDIADVDGDAKLDIVTVNEGSVSLLRGDGAGGFAPKQDVANPYIPGYLAVGDLDGDGRAEVLVATVNYVAGQKLSLYPGTATGLGTRIDRDLPMVASIRLADLDADGALDLIWTAHGYQVEKVVVERGTGLGGFDTAHAFSGAVSPPLANGGPINPREVAVADVNRDGKLDLVVRNLEAKTVGVLLGTGTGTFGAPAVYAALGEVSSLAVGDLDHDGRQDIVTSFYGGLAVLRGY